MLIARTRVGCRTTYFYGVEVIVIIVLQVVGGERAMRVAHPSGGSKFGPIPSLPAFDEGNVLG